MQILYVGILVFLEQKVCWRIAPVIFFWGTSRGLQCSLGRGTLGTHAAQSGP